MVELRASKNAMWIELHIVRDEVQISHARLKALKNFVGEFHDCFRGSAVLSKMVEDEIL
jgi:hypothetical protein